MSSRKEEKERRRQERLEQEQLLAQQGRRRRLYGIVAASVLAGATLVVIAVVVAAGGGDSGGNGTSESKLPPAVDPPAQKIDGLPEAAKAADCRLSNPPIEGRQHVEETPKYGTNPPTSGNHNPQPAADGAYSKAPPITQLVHALEHGRVEYQFDPSIGKRRIGQLRGLYDEDPYHAILTPNTTRMPFEMAAVAWGHFAGCKKFSNASFDALRAFKTRYQDKGPEFVP